MNEANTLKEVLDIQRQQLFVLNELLEKTKNKNAKYRDYLEEQCKSSEDYQKSLEKSANDAAKREDDRLKEHEAYIRGQNVARMANYIRMLSSVCLVGLVAYLAIFGIHS